MAQRQPEIGCGKLGSRQIIVLGMHRSGTSMLAHLVHAAGVSIGQTSDLLTPDSNNPSGYWEHEPLVKFNNFLLKTADASWAVPPSSSDQISDLLKQSALVERAQQLIQSMGSLSPLWVWKDPRLSLLLPFWRALLPNAVYIIAIRHPVAVAHSLKTRNGFPLSAGILLWQLYVQSILCELPQEAPSLHVSYEGFLQQPSQECIRLSGFLNDTFGAVSDARQRLDAMMGVIETEGRDSSRPSGSESLLLDSGQRKLYDACQELTREGGKSSLFHTPGYEVYPGWRDYLSLCEGVFLRGRRRMRAANNSASRAGRSFMIACSNLTRRLGLFRDRGAKSRFPQ